jgi:aryl-alcohol dehydrogenase-like predicted oxidoreductase
VPIPGTKRRKYVEANAAAADMHLSPAEIAEIEEAVPKNAVAGERYSAEMMQTIDR